MPGDLAAGSGVLEHPHRRYDPLAGRWVLVSAGRLSRPWQGEHAPPAPRPPPYDPGCYLCPGNVRAGGERNPDYRQTFVFTNDFAALRPDTPPQVHEPHPLLRAQGQPGTCRVLCFSPRHDLSLAGMPLAGVRAVVDLWGEQVGELASRYRWVQVFENRGETMGASNPHPHGQVWATAGLPEEPAREDRRQRAYLERTGVPLLVEYARTEASGGTRVVAETAGWLAVVPFWATWPFETLVLPRRHVRHLPDLGPAERDGLAELLSLLLGAYDGLFALPFPYSMGWHGAPGGAGADEAGAAGGAGGAGHWQLHAHFYPPLLRSASVRKHMVGYELLADVQRDLTAEEAAERLRAVAGAGRRGGR